MRRDEMDALNPGDLIRHVHSGDALIVHANHGGRVLAVRVTEASNPSEWHKVDAGGRVTSTDTAYAPDWKPLAMPPLPSGMPYPSRPARATE